MIINLLLMFMMVTALIFICGVAIISPAYFYLTEYIYIYIYFFFFLIAIKKYSKKINSPNTQQNPSCCYNFFLI